MPSVWFVFAQIRFMSLPSQYFVRKASYFLGMGRIWGSVRNPILVGDARDTYAHLEEVALVG